MLHSSRPLTFNIPNAFDPSEESGRPVAAQPRLRGQVGSYPCEHTHTQSLDLMAIPCTSLLFTIPLQVVHLDAKSMGQRSIAKGTP